MIMIFGLNIYEKKRLKKTVLTQLLEEKGIPVEIEAGQNI